MRRGVIIGALILLAGCAHKASDQSGKLVSMQLYDRNGFQETISSSDRLNLYTQTDFCAAQPYQKVVRLYSRNREGKTEARVTSYHDSGGIWQYLETENGRAKGSYKEWYPSGALKVEALVVEGIGDLAEECIGTWVFHGLSKAYDDKGNAVAEIEYDRGELPNVAKYFHPNGKVKKEVPYLRGLIEGNVHYYDTKGKLIGKSRYRNGLQCGLTVFIGDKSSPRYTEEYKEGKLLNASYYNFKDELVSEVVNGVGVQTVYENGALLETHEIVDGVVGGVVLQYTSDGNLASRFSIRNGQKHGEEILFFPNTGKKKMSLEWYDDEIHGKVRTWYASGTLESERDLYNNKKHGNALAWYRDGNLMLMEEYEHDTLMCGSYFRRGDGEPVSKVEDGSGTTTLFDPDGHFVRRAAYLKGMPIDE
ncbi:MAG: hypothetical protein P0S94_00570 [Simkaniaceae bacterium]|nr:hypothetical protein [Simkaniaceae bacterium]